MLLSSNVLLLRHEGRHCHLKYCSHNIKGKKAGCSWRTLLSMCFILYAQFITSSFPSRASYALSDSWLQTAMVSSGFKFALFLRMGWQLYHCRAQIRFLTLKIVMMDSQVMRQKSIRLIIRRLWIQIIKCHTIRGQELKRDKIGCSFLSITACMQKWVDSAFLWVCYVAPWQCMSCLGRSTWWPSPSLVSSCCVIERGRAAWLAGIDHD